MLPKILKILGALYMAFILLLYRRLYAGCPFLSLKFGSVYLRGKNIRNIIANNLDSRIPRINFDPMFFLKSAEGGFVFCHLNSL